MPAGWNTFDVALAEARRALQAVARGRSVEERGRLEAMLVGEVTSGLRLRDERADRVAWQPGC